MKFLKIVGEIQKNKDDEILTEAIIIIPLCQIESMAELIGESYIAIDFITGRRIIIHNVSSKRITEDGI